MNLNNACIVMNNRVIAKAYAKINYTLDVKNLRSDGYHNIESIMQAVSLFDLLIIDKWETEGIQLSTNLRFLPVNEKNIAYKAAMMFFDKTGIRGGVKILIHKNIPIGAGLGGGSADGAAVLVSLNRLFSNPLSEAELMSLGAKLGADVPFCISCGAAIATGIGEILKPIPYISGMPLVIVKPKISLSTAEMYKAVDEAEIQIRPDTEAMAAALQSGSVKDAAKYICNVFEKPAIEQNPVINEIKEKLMSAGAINAMMTGSGSAVFGIFETEAKADICMKIMSREFDDVFSVSTI